MLVIRTSEKLARALDSPLEPELKRLLAAHRDRLSEYEGYTLGELAEFAIIEPGDNLQDLSRIVEIEPGEGGVAPAFALLPEYVERHETTFELCFILSDDGFGRVLFIPTSQDVDPVISSLAMSCLEQLTANSKSLARHHAAVAGNTHT